MKLGYNGKVDLLPVEFEMGARCTTKGGCSLVGDIRGDENIALHSMHTLWVREHNRIAKTLKPLNPLWTDELLYKTARKINTALWQHIIYNEYIPLLANLPAYTGYNDTVDPSILNAFSTAAFRYGHSLVPNEFPQLDRGFNPSDDSIVLQNAFFNREIINQRGIEPTMFGLLANTSNNVDDGFAHSIARKLFVAVGSEESLDLTALNIQRGRDHGLPGYNAYREKCGLVKVTWQNIDQFIISSAASKLQSIYSDVDDIDLYAGGISEKHMENLQVGPTFNCILSQQFQALRDGDRFYYENPGLFSEDQLQSIKNVTMSTILCNNLKGIVSIQPNAFRTPEYMNNARIVCDSIPKLTLTAWQGELEFHDEEESNNEIDADMLKEMSQRRNVDKRESDTTNEEKVESVQHSNEPKDEGN
ncbi:MAG: peroxidase family protein, partial [Cyanobacteria bacterium J06649_11]